MLDAVKDDAATLRTWASKKRCEIRHYGVRGAAVAARELFWQAPLRLAGRYVWNYGTPIFEREWDVLVVLDSCRADLFAEVADEYDYLHTHETTASVGSFTREWIDKNFAAAYTDEMARTAYVTGNPFSERTSPDDWAHLIEVWREYRTNNGAVSPRVMTDHAIAAAREFDPERMIVHYMQPHQPFRSLHDFDTIPECLPRDVWRLLALGALSRKEVWEAYRDNLQWVLDDVETLIDQLGDQEILITSDHGNALGEWGTYGHARFLPVPAMKEVPWIRITPTDADHTYDPTETAALNADRMDADVDERLAALGYQ